MDLQKGEAAMFRVGDTVVHPHYGAGVVTDIRELEYLGNERKTYYSIKLLTEPDTVVMVPLRNEREVGLRATVPESRLSRVWRILRSDPRKLPSDHNERYEMLKDELHSGSVYRIAEVLRDLAWRRDRRQHLTIRGKRLYDRALEFLAGEVAAAQGEDVDAAESQISGTLSQTIVAASPVM
jgi:CarD family transcriptional regulator